MIRASSINCELPSYDPTDIEDPDVGLIIAISATKTAISSLPYEPTSSKMLSKIDAIESNILNLLFTNKQHDTSIEYSRPEYSIEILEENTSRSTSNTNPSQDTPAAFGKALLITSMTASEPSNSPSDSCAMTRILPSSTPSEARSISRARQGLFFPIDDMHGSFSDFPDVNLATTDLLPYLQMFTTDELALAQEVLELLDEFENGGGGHCIAANQCMGKPTRETLSLDILLSSLPSRVLELATVMIMQGLREDGDSDGDEATGVCAPNNATMAKDTCGKLSDGTIGSIHWTNNVSHQDKSQAGSSGSSHNGSLPLHASSPFRHASSVESCYNESTVTTVLHQSPKPTLASSPIGHTFNAPKATSTPSLENLPNRTISPAKRCHEPTESDSKKKVTMVRRASLARIPFPQGSGNLEEFSTPGTVEGLGHECDHIISGAPKVDAQRSTQQPTPHCNCDGASQSEDQSHNVGSENFEFSYPFSTRCRQLKVSSMNVKSKSSKVSQLERTVPTKKKTNRSGGNTSKRLGSNIQSLLSKNRTVAQIIAKKRRRSEINSAAGRSTNSTLGGRMTSAPTQGQQKELDNMDIASDPLSHIEPDGPLSASNVRDGDSKPNRRPFEGCIWRVSKHLRKEDKKENVLGVDVGNLLTTLEDRNTTRKSIFSASNLLHHKRKHSPIEYGEKGRTLLASRLVFSNQAVDSLYTTQM